MDGSPSAAGECSEYLCTLQLPEHSALREAFAQCRSVCRKELGDDETGLYRPHVSVTGFFEASPKQAAAFIGEVASLATSLAMGECKAAMIELRDTISTDTGHVIFDIHAPGVAALAQTLPAKAAALGVKVRAKAVSHLSLASGRCKDEQTRVEQIYDGLQRGHHQLDLVVSKLLRRSDVSTLKSSGAQHVFADLLRVPLGVAPPPPLSSEAAPSLTSASALACFNPHPALRMVRRPRRHRARRMIRHSSQCRHWGSQCCAAPECKWQLLAPLRELELIRSSPKYRLLP